MLAKPLVRVILAAFMLAAVSFRLRVNVYKPITTVLHAWGLWLPTDLMQSLQSWIGL